jgi:uncharacterized protein
MSNSNNDLTFRLTSEKDIEIRAAEGDKPARLVGYAAVFNSLSADLGGFKERLVKGAFRGSVANGIDVRALVDHDSSKLLGRTSNGTLRIAEDEVGLRVEIDMPPTTYANDVLALVQRRDVKGMSFGFRVPNGGQRFVKEGGQTIREITSADLKEVTVTSRPAYDATSVYVRVAPDVLTEIRALEENPRPLLSNARKTLLTNLVKG